jgi:hypothetical protein
MTLSLWLSRNSEAADYARAVLEFAERQKMQIRTAGELWAAADAYDGSMFGIISGEEQ